MPKKFYEINICGQYYIELFGHNLCRYGHIVLSFDSGYAAKGVNYSNKSFMKLTPGVSVGKTFLFHLHLDEISLAVYPLTIIFSLI
jgi:hypothetical protein